MQIIEYTWDHGDGVYTFEFAFVRGTHGEPFPFGEEPSRQWVHVPDFFIGVLPVTQALWIHVMGDNPAVRQGGDLPLENVSWDEVTQPGGFLDRINESPVRKAVIDTLGARSGVFRLPSETEWEYAARGGTHWRDDFRFSGSNDIDAVAWYDRRHGDHTQPVGRKAPNQLGIHDMSGNIWEWCQDVYTSEVERIPQDGTAFVGSAEERVLRGGCFHNWAIHCTVWKRYEIARQFHDGCIGFRLALSVASGA